MPDLAAMIAHLNPPQQAAVAALSGPVLVLAGAGTGKTRVLTTRLARLIATGTAQPQQVLAVTFTNKAAREMAERVESLLQAPTAGMFLGTFHSLGARMLRKHAEYVGLRPDFTILDTDDQKRLLTQLLQDANIDTTAHPVRLLSHIISSWKDKGWEPHQVPKAEDGFANRQGVRLYRQYQERLAALNAVDFGDLLLLPVKILQEQKQVLEWYQHQFTHILVDEYQDTNSIQYQWLRLLSLRHKNICVVGDDDQSIYGWRGAEVGNILRFESDFPGAQVIRLEQNYRSTGNILQAASHLIRCNAERHGKTLWTEAGAGEPVHVHPVSDDREEARFVAESCERWLNTGQPLAECAVLVRTQAQTRSLEEQFIKTGMPYVVIGGLKFYERKEIRDALAYLRLIQNPADDLAYQRIVNVPRRGVGPGALETLAHITKTQNCSLLAATGQAVAAHVISGKAKKELEKLVDQLTVWQNLSSAMPPDRLLEQVLEEAGYAEMLRNDKDPDAKARLDNLKELIRAMQDYPDLQSFLEHVALVTDNDTAQGDAVRLMTIHAAKGLEFALVFIPGFEDGLFPNQRTLNETGTKGIEEERRLAYVAITRAKQELHLTYCANRRLYGQFQPSVASRFLQELPKDALKLHSPTGGYSQVAYRPSYGSTLDRRSASDFAKPAEPLIPYRSVVSVADWDAGERVFHQKFGYGSVQKMEGRGESARLHIMFDKAGAKTLVANLANLERVG